MIVELKNGKLVITIDANVKNPMVSESGKTLSVASTRGAAGTSIMVKESPLVVNVNAYIRNPDYIKPPKG